MTEDDEFLPLKKAQKSILKKKEVKKAPAKKK
jgi:hypothetical protein